MAGVLTLGTSTRTFGHPTLRANFLSTAAAKDVGCPDLFEPASATTAPGCGCRQVAGMASPVNSNYRYPRGFLIPDRCPRAADGLVLKSAVVIAPSASNLLQQLLYRSNRRKSVKAAPSLPVTQQLTLRSRPGI